MGACKTFFQNMWAPPCKVLKPQSYVFFERLFVDGKQAGMSWILLLSHQICIFWHG